MSLLVAKNVLKLHSGQPILDGLSVSVKRGETVAIVGESGCGKSTLLRCLCGLAPLDGGLVTVDGQSMEDVGPCAWRATVLYCPQERHANGFFATPFAMAQYIGKMAAVQKPDLPVKAAEIAERLKLEGDKFFASWDTLSGGEKARCRLSIVLAQAPPFLLLDEPTAALDATTSNLFLKEVKRCGAGVLWITHDEGQAQHFDRTVRLVKPLARVL